MEGYALKIIHTADIHIASPLRGLTGEKAQRRKAEIIDGFARLCAYAKSQAVAVVLIVGDLFDDNAVERGVLSQVLSIIENAKPTSFFYVLGNHDELSLQGATLPDNLFTFSKARGWQSYDVGENVAITGMDSRYFSMDKFETLTLSPNRFNVLLLHGDIYTQGGKESIPLALLQNKHVDYLALGHIHATDVEAKPLDARGKYRYCGCPEGRGFDELGKKGFFLLDIQNGRIVNERFLSFARREMVERRVDVSACATYADLENKTLSALQNCRAEDMVKIVLCGNHAYGLKKDLALLSVRIGERFFHLKIEDESRPQIEPSAYERDCTERGEFVREVYRAALVKELETEILEVGLKALDGEEIEI